MSPPRRIAAIVVPRLAAEIARRDRDPSDPILKRPLAIVLGEGDGASEPPPHDTSHDAASLVSAVDDEAERLGVRPGMHVSEAMARSASISFALLTPRTILGALAAIAEVALSFGTMTEIDAPFDADRRPDEGAVLASLDRGALLVLDTVWVDVTGVAHLFGGEEALQRAMVEAITQLGFRVSVAIAEGPFLAQALARSAPRRPAARAIVPNGEARSAIAGLPVSALGLGPEATAFFTRLGVRAIGDMMKIDRAQLMARLSAFLPSARAEQEIFDWLEGRDPRPLVPYEPAPEIEETIGFDDGVEAAEQLVFAVRSLVSRLSARLTGRRQACNRIDIALRYDRSIFALRTSTARDGSPSLAPLLGLSIDLPAPLCHTDDLFRAIKAKVESLELLAPVVHLAIKLTRIANAPRVQLDLSRGVSVDPDALPALLSELSAEIGADRVGVLQIEDDHRPEHRSRLVGIVEAATRRAPRRAREQRAPTPPDRSGRASEASEAGEPVRLLPEPVPIATGAGGGGLSALWRGEGLTIDRQTYVVEEVRFDRRLDTIAWWTTNAASRDYLRVTLREAGRPGEPRATAFAWIFLDRRTGELFLQGFWE